ncbi:MAG TPA: hypothetical protein VEI49_11325 [Terriglobales bacterium]|nr:hypothetical protein [Terriglobales bacterium]
MNAPALNKGIRQFTGVPPDDLGAIATAFGPMKVRPSEESTCTIAQQNVSSTLRGFGLDRREDIEAMFRVVHLITMHGNPTDAVAYAFAEKQFYSSRYFQIALDLSFCIS